MAQATKARCRLCGAEAAERFRHQVLGRHDTAYSQCLACGSLQTDPPYWLGEIYNYSVGVEDTDYLSRNLDNISMVGFLLWLFRVPLDRAILDFGGGLGLAPRYFAERGRHAFCHDTFVTSPFPGLAWPGDRSVGFMLATELFEHLPDPRRDLDELFGLDPDVLFVTTCRYKSEGRDWFYLVPDIGEHVFFYSDEAMRLIAARYGYHVALPSWRTAIFSRTPLSLQQRMIAKLGLRDGTLGRFVRAMTSPLLRR